MTPIRVCFVCSGNICRSPTAEVVFGELAQRAGRTAEFDIASAGTGGWHVGAEMDPRSRATLQRAGYPVPAHRARQFRAEDFYDYDLVLAIDAGHAAFLTELAADADDPDQAAQSIKLLRSFDPEAAAPEGATPKGATPDLDIPDPYYGGPDGFVDVLAMVERSCAGLLARLRPVQQRAELV